MRKRFNYVQLLVVSLSILGLAVLYLGVPHTASYKGYVKSLWTHNHPALAYYLNFTDGNLALQTGNYFFGSAYDLVKAKESFKLALRLDPNAFLAHYQLGRIYFVEGDLKDALAQVNAELEEHPSNLRALYVRGLIEDAQGNLFGAETDFTRFVAWAPTEWGGYNDLSFILSKEGKYTEAEKTIQQAMKLVPHANQVPWLYNSLGLAELNLGKTKEAHEAFAKALPLASAITPKQWVRAYSANDPASVQKSITAFQKAIQENLRATEEKVQK